MTKQQQIRIEISANLSPIGMAIHSLINMRVNFPTLYTGNGSCRKSTLEEAAEYAEIRKIIEYPNFPKVFVVDFKTKTDSVVGVKETLSVNKQSILNLREEV